MVRVQTSAEASAAENRRTAIARNSADRRTAISFLVPAATNVRPRPRILFPGSVLPSPPPPPRSKPSPSKSAIPAKPSASSISPASSCATRPPTPSTSPPRRSNRKGRSMWLTSTGACGSTATPLCVTSCARSGKNSTAPRPSKSNRPKAISRSSRSAVCPASCSVRRTIMTSNASSATFIANVSPVSTSKPSAPG